MSTTSLIEDPAPIQNQYRPEKFADRDKEKKQLQQLHEGSIRNLFLHGPSGTGKTHLLLNQLEKLPSTINSCYIPCRRCDTQYKALKQLYQVVTGEQVSTGHHTAKLQREIENRTTEAETLVVLDDVDFLLLNDGDSLLYKLSRTNPGNLGIILISSQTQDLSEQLEERTYSSLQPQRIGFEPYTAAETFQILRQRAQDALKPQSLHREALTYIASTTQNISKGLTWLKTAAETTQGDRVTEETVNQCREEAYQSFIDQQLRRFTDHHHTLIQAIRELEEQQDSPVNTGKIYNRYQELYKGDSVSDRRLSTYLKHLELLNLINVEYYYGGKNGKTREIQLTEFG